MLFLFKYTIGTFLITEVSWGKSREVYPFLFKTDKGRRRKGTPTFRSLPTALSKPAWLDTMVQVRETVFIMFPFGSLGLMLEALQSGGRRKGRGRDGRQEDITDKNKGPADSEAHAPSSQEELTSSNMKRQVRRGLRELPFSCGVAGSLGCCGCTAKTH